MSYVKCPMSYVLCPMLYVLCPMKNSYILCPVDCVLCPMSYVLCSKFHVLCHNSYVLCTMSSVLYFGGSFFGPKSVVHLFDHLVGNPVKNLVVRSWLAICFAKVGGPLLVLCFSQVDGLFGGLLGVSSSL